jgi:hypothetical protein
MSIKMCSFAVYNIILFVIWTHPQRLTSSNPRQSALCSLNTDRNDASTASCYSNYRGTGLHCFITQTPYR